MDTSYNKMNGISFEFTGTGRVGTRLFRGQAGLKENNGKYIVSGSALKGNSMAFVGLYWVCALVTALGVWAFLSWVAAELGCYKLSPDWSNYLKFPVTLIIDLTVTVCCIGGAYYAAILLCKFVLRERAVAELSPNSVVAIVKGREYVQRQMENKPPVLMCHATIRMKNSALSIRIVCRQKDFSLLSSLLGVPLKNE